MADKDSDPTPPDTVTVTDKEELPPPPQPQPEPAPDSSTAESLDTENRDLPPPPPPPPSEVAAEKDPTPPPPSEVAAEKDSTPPPPPEVAEKDPTPPPPVEETETETETEPKPNTSDTKEDVVVVHDEGSKQQPVDQEHKIPQNLVSFKEESNRVADLSESEKRALEELKQLVREALDTYQFTSPSQPPPPPLKPETTKEKEAPKPEGPTSESDASTEIKPPQEPKVEEHPPAKEGEEAAKEDEVSIWGVPLLKDDRSDVILLKFLRARDFKVKDAFVMIKNTIRWRKEFNIDGLVNEDLGDDLEKVVFMHGYSREGHPVCYNVYGEFQNKELYQKAFSNEERRAKFLRWRIQFLERSIRKLDFSPGGINTIFQVNDLKNSPGPGKRELRLATKQALQLLQDNYPEFVAKQVFINVPWWYLAFYTMISPFLTQRTKSKFVFAGPSKSADALFKYISPEQVPVQYGGLSVDFCDCNPDFSMSDPITEIPIKPNTKQTVEIAIYEKCIIVWELRVVGWEVSYGAEFKPDAKDAYTIIIHKATKMTPSDEPVVSNSFKVGELGKLLLTIDNSTLKKKRLLYRFKIKPYSD